MSEWPVSDPLLTLAAPIVVRTRLPKVGDTVWYWFSHAEWQHAGSGREEWTGRTEMRCRPARVTYVPTVPSAGLFTRLRVRPEFDTADRIEIAGRVVHPSAMSCQPDLSQMVIAHAEDDRGNVIITSGIDDLADDLAKLVVVGDVRNFWPREGTWTFRPARGADKR